jgi:hypothetical protein
MKGGEKMKTFLICLILSIFVFPVWASEDIVKMNPDGYIGGITIRIEPGFDYIDNAKTDNYIESNTITQDLRLSNWYVKGTILFPLDLKSSFFINLAIGKFEEEGLGDKNFWGWKTYYNRFSISGGFNFYFKSIFK